MIRYIIASVLAGCLFGFMDGLIHANPLAQKLYEVYKPMAKTSIPIYKGIAIDLFYGFAMAGIFLLLYPSLPGKSGMMKGIGFAALTWFFRVVMSVAGEWVAFNIPAKTLLYTLLTGWLEMLVLGVLYGMILQPPK